MAEPTKTMQLLEALVFGTAGTTGDAFFRDLVRHMAEALGVRLVFVSELSPDRVQARTLALWLDGDFADNLEYQLSGTPCERVIKGEVVHVPDNLHADYPDEPTVTGLGMISYLGIPLVGPSGHIVGHVVAMDEEPLHDHDHDFSAFSILATRAAAELERRKTEQELRHRVEIEGLITTISTAFINLATNEVDVMLTAALERIGCFVGADRSWIVQLSEGGRTFRFTHEWCPQGIRSELANPRVIDVDVCPIFISWEDPEQPLHVANTDGLPEDCALRRDLEADEIKSFISVPLMISGQIVGALGFDAMKEKKSWSEEDIRLLRLIGEIFASALERKWAGEELARAQARLIQSEKMAALGQITAGVAHEINTPAAVVKSGADIAQRTTARLRDVLAGALSPQQQALIENYLGILEEHGIASVEATTRITGIVDSLKNYTRHDQAEVQSTNLREGIEGAMMIVKSHLKQGVTVHRSYDDTTEFQANVSELNQVFMTLLKNANDAIDSKGAITVSTWADGDAVYARVADTGKGMSAGQVAELFDVGFASKGSRIGMRMGLSQAQSVIDKHRGSIQVNSEPGSGTEITISMPRP